MIRTMVQYNDNKNDSKITDLRQLDRKSTTTVANGAREKPFPSLSMISASMLVLLTKQRTNTAIPTPASKTS